MIVAIVAACVVVAGWLVVISLCVAAAHQPEPTWVPLTDPRDLAAAA